MVRERNHDEPHALRVLLGPWEASAEWVGQVAGADVIAFGASTALPYDPYRESLADLLARLPAGWQPEILILWQPQVHAMPPGWEHLGLPTFAVLVDWQLLGLLDGSLDWLRAFDGLFLDRPGVDFLKGQGFENVWPFLPSSFDPALHRPDPAAQKLYDISFAGTFFHPIHHKRSVWLYRLAQLAERYRIGFFSWRLDALAYTRLLQQSKIAFNYSYRGELNIRSFETLATGALLFLEEGNADVAGHFEDGVHYVSYNADNYAERLDYYLTHAAERERIAEAGRQQVQRHTHAAHLAWLVEQVRPWRHQPRAPRLAAWTPRQRGLNQFANFYAAVTPERARAIYAAWDQAARAAGDDAAWLEAALAAVDYRLNEALPEAEQSPEAALNHLTRAIQLAPERAWPLFSLGVLLWRSCGEPALAADVLQKAVTLLRLAPRQAAAVFGPYIPCVYDHFMVAWLQANLRTRQTGGNQALVWAVLLEARCQEFLAQIYLKQQQPGLAQAAQARAAELFPANDLTHVTLAKVAEQNGDWATALTAYRQALAIQPINPEAWRLTAQLLLNMNQPEAGRDFCAEHLRALKGFPGLQENVPPLQALLAEAQARLTPAG